MLPKVLFWLFVAIDAAGLSLLFVLGLAAAGSAKSSPLAVAFAMLVVPGLVLGGMVLLHERTSSPALRLVAFLVVSAPAVALAVGRVVAEFMARSNPGGIWGETALTRALRELPDDPTRLETIRTLLAAGADPNEAGEELPLALAVWATRQSGDAALRQLLDAGADPNVRDAFGSPVFFAATGAAIATPVLQLLLDRGADPTATERDGRSGAWSAIDTQNWPAALLLVQRGAGTGGISPMGMTMVATLEGHVRTHGDGGGVGELLTAVRAKSKRR